MTIDRSPNHRTKVTKLPQDPMSFFPHMSKEDREKFEEELDDYMTKCIQEEQDRIKKRTDRKNETTPGK